MEGEAGPGPPDASPPPPSRGPIYVVPVAKVREARGDVKIPVSRSKVASTRAFRRIFSDRALGVIGLAVVVLGVWLLFKWEAELPPKPPTYSVNWPEDPHVLANATIGVAAGATQSSPFEIDYGVAEANVTKMTLTVTWRDDVGDEQLEWDRVSFELVGPVAANRTLSLYNRSAPNTNEATFTVSAPVVALPALREVQASTLEEAAAAAGDHTNGNGTDDWRLRIWFEAVGDDYTSNEARALGDCPAPTPLCTPDPGQVDPNGIRVVATYQTYRMELVPNQ